MNMMGGCVNGWMGRWVWYAAHAMLFEPICWSPISMNWVNIKMNHKSFLMRRPSSRKDRLFKWNEYICHKIVAVLFGIIWESVDNIRVTRILYDCRHKFFALNITSHIYDHIISRQSLHVTWSCIQRKPRLITRHEMISIISFGNMQDRQHGLCLFHPFSAQIMRQQMRHQMQMKQSETNRVM
jgi:hypothetical protein